MLAIFCHVAYRSTDKKNVFKLLFSYFLVLLDHGFHCGTLKLLDGH